MMRSLFVMFALAFLTACPKGKEIAAMMDEFSAKRTAAIQVIEQKDFSLENLLKAQDYFFEFTEKVHLLQVEPDAIKDTQKMIKKKGARVFCEAYMMPIETWRLLQTYCQGGAFYRCSPEIREYDSTNKKMRELIGAEYAGLLAQETTCR